MALSDEGKTDNNDYNVDDDYDKIIYEYVDDKSMRMKAWMPGSCTRSTEGWKRPPLFGPLPLIIVQTPLCVSDFFLNL